MSDMPIFRYRYSDIALLIVVFQLRTEIHFNVGICIFVYCIYSNINGCGNISKDKTD